MNKKENELTTDLFKSDKLCYAVRVAQRDEAVKSLKLDTPPHAHQTASSLRTQLATVSVDWSPRREVSLSRRQ